MDRDLFVQNIKKLCFARSELPTIACKAAGVGASFISDINRGRTPSIEKVQRLADYLNVSTSQLIGEEKLPDVYPSPKMDIPPKFATVSGVENWFLMHQNKPTVQDDGLTEAEQALMDLFRQLTPDQQDMVIRMVQAAADKQ